MYPVSPHNVPSIPNIRRISGSSKIGRIPSVLQTGAPVDLVRRRQVFVPGLGVGVVVGSDDGL